MNWNYLMPSAGVAMMLALLALTIGLPCWVWPIWATLTVVAFVQAVRS